ncbi:MAG: CCA tRNA nucleotidyltransferase [Candidatus Diapherotrites archaeon]|nr:CCA tRNA nucleotidyltransferase [Candidatus Diapherotrites archaeon]
MINIKKLLEKTLKKIKPIEKELKEEKKFTEEIIEKIQKLNPNIQETVLAGSLSRETHLKGDRDFDIFILFDSKMPLKEFEFQAIETGKKFFKGHKWEKAYSQHPYIKGEINGFKIEVVPSYKISGTELMQSAVDRTPFHTKYLERKLTEKQKDEVRLLKKFLKGINAYGAELKTNSMPGYLTELLILNYGSFENTLKEVSKWKTIQIIDLEKQLTEEEAKKFDSPLIVIDPVDKTRNVAAAVSMNQKARFIAAAREFLKKPSEKFFFEHKRKILNKSKIKEFLKKKELIALKINYPKGELADNVWGQLKRLSKKIANALEEKEFIVYRFDEWTDEKKEMIIMLELESLVLQKTKKLIGPEITQEEHVNKFLEAHKKKLSGPRIEKARIILEGERKYIKANKFIEDFIKKTSKEGKTAINKPLKKPVILNEKQIMQLFDSDKQFARFLSDYLIGKEVFY